MSITLPLPDHDVPVVGIPFPNVPYPPTWKAARYGASQSGGAANDRAVSPTEKRLALALGKRTATAAQKPATWGKTGKLQHWRGFQRLFEN